MSRPDGRQPDDLRPISFERDFTTMAAGSVLVAFGDTRVLCTASIDEDVPRWMKGKGRGWVTAEYSMLPGSSPERVDREAVRGRQGGRTMEIQRLIGRSLRAVTDLVVLGERQVVVDCDVLQADGGTRTASICGGYLALHDALSRLGPADAGRRRGARRPSFSGTRQRLRIQSPWRAATAAAARSPFSSSGSGALEAIRRTGTSRRSRDCRRSWRKVNGSRPRTDVPRRIAAGGRSAQARSAAMENAWAAPLPRTYFIGGHRVEHVRDAHGYSAWTCDCADFVSSRGAGSENGCQHTQRIAAAAELDRLLRTPGLIVPPGCY